MRKRNKTYDSSDVFCELVNGFGPRRSVHECNDRPYNGIKHITNRAEDDWEENFIEDVEDGIRDRIRDDAHDADGPMKNMKCALWIELDVHIEGQSLSGSTKRQSE